MMKNPNPQYRKRCQGEAVKLPFPLSLQAILQFPVIDFEIPGSRRKNSLLCI
jgi:hypothetical protein